MKTLIILVIVFLVTGGFQLYKKQGKLLTNSADFLKIGKIVYPSYSKEFEIFFNLYLTDKTSFQEDQQHLIEEYGFESLNALEVTYMFGDSRKLVGYIDWQGEENEREVEDYIESQLPGTTLTWSSTKDYRQKKAKSAQTDGIFIIELFKVIDKDLRPIHKRLLFYELGFDAYVFQVVDITTFDKVVELAPSGFYGTEKLKP